METLNTTDFPILSRQVYGRRLVYLDNAATTQKPRCVIDAMTDEYYNANANVHRGVHYLSQLATDMHEQARQTVCRFLNADSTDEIVFTRGTTESINLVATSLSRLLASSHSTTTPPPTVKPPYEVIVSAMEHHSNIVPWQLAGFKLRVIPMRDDFTLDLDALDGLFSPHTVMVSVTHVSNVLGTVNDLPTIIAAAHNHGVPVLVDAAQSTPHTKVDVQSLGCDFLAFSGHKIYGPTGIGVLYGRREWLDRLPPYMGGGEMIKNVSFERTTYNALPYKFEAGTPDYIATTGLAKALDYVSALGMDNIANHEHDLLLYAIDRLKTAVPNIDIYSPAAVVSDAQTVSANSHTTSLSSPTTLSDSHTASAVISFNVPGIHHLDIGTLLDRLGIAVRTGHHCAEPLMRRLGVEGTVRASVGLYNTKEDIDAFCNALQRVVSMF